MRSCCLRLAGSREGFCRLVAAAVVASSLSSTPFVGCRVAFVDDESQFTDHVIDSDAVGTGNGYASSPGAISDGVDVEELWREESVGHWIQLSRTSSSAKIGGATLTVQSAESISRPSCHCSAIRMSSSSDKINRSSAIIPAERLSRDAKSQESTPTRHGPRPFNLDDQTQTNSHPSSNPLQRPLYLQESLCHRSSNPSQSSPQTVNARSCDCPRTRHAVEHAVIRLQSPITTARWSFGPRNRQSRPDVMSTLTAWTEARCA